MGIDRAFFQKGTNFHSNEKRTVIEILDDAMRARLNYTISQVRILFVHTAAALGGHWREYAEVYGIIGEARFELEDIDTQLRGDYTLQTGDTLFVPPRIALRVKSSHGCVIACLSERDERERGTHPYPRLVTEA